MDMSSSGCWDCPVPIKGLVVAAIVGLFLLFLGRVLARSRGHLAQVAGASFLLLAAVTYLLSLESVRRFGIAWHENRLLGVHRAKDLAFIALWSLLTVLLWVGTKRPSTNPASSAGRGAPA